MALEFTKLTVGDAVKTIGTRCFKKLTTESPATADCTGTWVLNETIDPYTTDKLFKDVTGTVLGNSFYRIRFIKGGTIGGASVGYFALTSGNVNTFMASYYFSADGSSVQTSGYVQSAENEYLAPSVESRTFTITGGDNAQDVDLYEWLTANAVKQS